MEGIKEYILSIVTKTTREDLASIPVYLEKRMTVSEKDTNHLYLIEFDGIMSLLEKLFLVYGDYFTLYVSLHSSKTGLEDKVLRGDYETVKDSLYNLVSTGEITIKRMIINVKNTCLYNIEINQG